MPRLLFPAGGSGTEANSAVPSPRDAHQFSQVTHHDPAAPRQATESHIMRTYLVFDLESAVLDESGHRRYLQMERYVPGPDDQPSRRGYKRSEDPLKTPRWVFQSIVTASVMLLAEHPEGNLEVSRLVTLSAPDHSEREIVEGLLQIFQDAPENTELVSWGGCMHDIPMLVCGAMRYGLTLPRAWQWMSFGGDGRNRHIDFARILTGGLKMKPIHQSEYLAALDIPGKLSAAPWQVAQLIYAGNFDRVQEVCEGDVISCALLLARWRKLHDPRVGHEVVEERILRQVSELRAGRGYVGQLRAGRTASFKAHLEQAVLDMERLAPWLIDEAA